MRNHEHQEIDKENTIEFENSGYIFVDSDGKMIIKSIADTKTILHFSFYKKEMKSASVMFGGVAWR